MRNKLAVIAILGAAHTASFAGVDLNTWLYDPLAGPEGTFTINSPTTATFNSGVPGKDVGTSRGLIFSGSNDVKRMLRADVMGGTRLDDDFFGFVVGYNDNDHTSASPDYLLIDWKQETQFHDFGAGGGDAKAGLALSKVTGAVAGPTPGGDYAWQHTGPVVEQMRATTLGDTGWLHGSTYAFEIAYLPDKVQVFVDGTLELEYAGSISDGSFGLYGFSQDGVQFSNVRISPVIPAPSAILLGTLGTGLVGWLRRRRTF